MEEDRHKLKRVYMSGADKRKLAKEKDKKNTEIISKTRRMTEFFITSTTQLLLLRLVQSFTITIERINITFNNIYFLFFIFNSI